MNLSSTIGAAKQAVTSKAGLSVLAAQKHSPAILFGAGVVGMVGTVVMASRATLKLSDVLDEFEDKKELSAELRETKPEKYSAETMKSDAVVLRTHLIMDIVKLYAPAVGLGVISVGALGGSHYILTKRNAALTAAYAAVVKSFSEYRERVVASEGKDKDLEFMYGVTERDMYVGEKKNGEPKIESVKSFGAGSSPYSVIFDDTNLNWQDTPEYNAFFLRLVQNHLNDRLRVKGHVFLNDAYRDLGMPDTEAGAVTGWLYKGEGDGFIDFGCWTDNTLEDIRYFMRDGNRGILLDFNVDGPIFKKLPGKKA